MSRLSYLVTAKTDSRQGDGVLVAQGGSRVGYALYVDAGHPVFALRNHGEMTLVRGPERLSTGASAVAAVLAKDGTASVAVDGKTVATAKHNLLYDMPTEGLEVGKDLRAAVGEYKGENPFAGEIREAHIRLE